MKLALIFFSLNVRGGSASVFLSLARQFKQQGHEVDVYTYYFDPENCFPELTMELSIKFVQQVEKNFRVRGGVVNKIQLGLDYYWRWPRLYRLMKDQGYDAILASEATAYLPALAYKKEFGTPVFWSVFDPLPQTWPHSIHTFFDRRKLQQIDCVIVPTQKMKQAMDRYYAINSLVLPLAGVREEEFQVDQRGLIKKRLREKFGFERRDETVIFSTGHFLPHRRYEDVLVAIRMLVDEHGAGDTGNAGIGPTKYIISGSAEFDRNYYQKIVGLVRELGLKDLVLINNDFLSQKEMVGLYQSGDIFLSVNAGQTWGLSPFEALICKKPVIISKTMGCSEVLEDGQHVLVVPEKSPAAVAVALKKLLSQPELRRRLAKNGYQLTRDNFTYAKKAQQLSAVLSAFKI